MDNWVDLAEICKEYHELPGFKWATEKHGGSCWFCYFFRAGDGDYCEKPEKEKLRKRMEASRAKGQLKIMEVLSK